MPLSPDLNIVTHGKTFLGSVQFCLKKKKKKRLVPGKEILTNTTIVYVDVWSEACEMFRLVRECDREVQLWQTDPNMTLVLISNPAGEAGIQRDPITSFIGPQRAPS